MAGSSRPATLEVVATDGFSDYALLDSGNGRKLERFGRFTVDRPEPQVMWQPVLEPSAWLQSRHECRENAPERRPRTTNLQRPCACG